MHESDTFLQQISRFRHGPIEHRVAPVISGQAGQWNRWCRHDVWAFDLVDGPGVEVDVEAPDGRRLTWMRSPEQWHGYPPGCAYRERYRQPTAIREWMWFLIAAEFRLPTTSQGCIVISDPEGRLSSLCRAMYAHQQRGGFASDIALHGLFTATIGELLSAAATGDGTAAHPWRLIAPAGSATLLEQLDRLVCPRLAKPPSVSELAATLGLSPSGLAHRLRQETGVTIVGRIRWLRIREARRLLSDGRSVKSVAHHMGFSGESYFAKVFASQVGMPPAAFRARARPTSR